MKAPSAERDFGQLTPSQVDRHRRMLATAADMVMAGGFDGLQMRDVATKADVALGTLYRYFPSKEYLLVSMMQREVERLAERLSVDPATGRDAAERVTSVLARANRALLRYPEVSQAHVRALVSGNQELAPLVTAITATMRGIILAAIGDDDASIAAGGPVTNLNDAQDVIDCADTLFDVWLAALVGWISGVTPAEQVQRKLERTIRLLLVPSVTLAPHER